MRSKLTIAGGVVLAAVGFVIALVALATPWVSYRVAADVSGTGNDLEGSGGIAVFQLDRGLWYVVALFALIGCVAGAAATRGRVARVAGVVGIAIGVAATLLASAVAAQIAGASVNTIASGLATFDFRAERSSGIGYGTAAPVLLALGGALLAVRTPSRVP